MMFILSERIMHYCVTIHGDRSCFEINCLSSVKNLNDFECINRITVSFFNAIIFMALNFSVTETYPFDSLERFCKILRVFFAYFRVYGNDFIIINCFWALKINRIK